MSTGTAAPTPVAFRVEARAASEETLVAALWELRTTGIEVQPAGEGTIALIACFADRAGLGNELRSLASIDGVIGVEAAVVPDVDWVARFREGFRPFTSGRFRIVPAWEADSGPGPILRILPGRAFGTGTHESTRLCLQALESLAERRPLGRAVDVGAGTGILAVAAARLGAGMVTAVDIDPDAIDSAREHARLNAVELRIVRGDGGRPLAGGRFDTVLGNISAPLLIERRSEIAALAAPAAVLILAGFLAEDVDAVAEAYAPVGPATVRSDGEWAAILVEAAR